MVRRLLDSAVRMHDDTGGSRRARNCKDDKGDTLPPEDGMPHRLAPIIICFALAVCSCGPIPVTREGSYAEDACIIVPAPSLSPDTIRIALPGPVDPDHAPVPRNESERILFGHLYRTLFTLDCRNKVRPALAAAWRGVSDGRRWLFEIRDDAFFHDGTLVTAADVVRCWERPEVAAVMRAARIDSVREEDTRIVAVHRRGYSSGSRREIPVILSTPPFSVALRTRYARWPIGTGPYAMEPTPVLVGRPYRGPLTARPFRDPGSPVLVFIEPGSRDPRDLLEGAVDVMVTSDIDVVDYATSRPHLVTEPLPWNRVYVLLSTTRAREVRWSRAPAGISDEFSASLALDAVRANARGHRGHSWWDDLSPCAVLHEDQPWRPALNHSAYSSTGRRRILYVESDPVARDLAERILALTASGPGSSDESRQIFSAVPGLDKAAPELSAEGVTEDEMQASLLEGEDFAYIITLPLATTDPRTEAEILVERARWLSGLCDGLADALIPLIDTRSHVIVRSGSAGISVDAYGTVRIVGSSASQGK
jgi:hypothetical protein